MARKQWGEAIHAWQNGLPNVPFPETLTVRTPKELDERGLVRAWKVVGLYAVMVETDWPHKKKAGLDVTVTPISGGSEDALLKMYRGVESEVEVRSLIGACVRVLEKGERPKVVSKAVRNRDRLRWAMQKKGLNV